MIQQKRKKKERKKIRILLSQFYYKVDKDKGSFFFQSLCEVENEVDILPFCILGQKNGYLISCCGNIKKRMMCEAKSRTRLNNLKPETLIFMALVIICGISRYDEVTKIDINIWPKTMNCKEHSLQILFNNLY